MQSRAGWYARRLAAMSPIEIADRLLQAGRRAIDARPPPAQPLLAPPLNLFPSLAAAAVKLGPHPEWQHAYEAAQAGRFAWFGVNWPPAARPDWHLDPITGRQWPRSPASKIDYRHDPAFGDVKCTWELNRLQYLQPIAALARATADQGPANLIHAHLTDWLDQNPAGIGINWASGIEMALRAVSVLLVASLIPLGDVLGRRIAQCLAATARHLARYPSRHSSANNHAIAEALGLLLIGRVLPHHPQGASWAQTGRRILAREAPNLVLPDGAGAEQAIGYHCFTLEMLALARLVDTTPLDLTAAGHFLRAMTGAGGQTPRIGDDDESRVIWSPPGPEPYALALQSVLGVAPIIAPPAHLRHALFGEPGAPARASDGFTHFPAGGSTILRTEGFHVVFDHGPLGYRSIAAHGHADALSLWVSLDGEPVLIDAGTFRYHGAGALRDALRGTAAHNTLTVAGADQSRIAGPFNWSHKARTTVIALDMAARRITAEHDGYQARFGCRHRRTLAAIPDGIAVTDQLLGLTPQPVAINFLVAPGIKAEPSRTGWQLGPLHLHHEGSLEATLEPAEFSPAMGVMAETTRLVFYGQLAAAPARFTLVRA